MIIVKDFLTHDAAEKQYEFRILLGQARLLIDNSEKTCYVVDTIY